MPATDQLIVICYDVSSNKARRRLAKRLEKVAVRVQESVFEARMQTTKAHRVGETLAKLLGPCDSLRFYTVGRAGLAASRAWGAVPMAGGDDFWVM
ncbi:MAG: CRISPR-associated endonuclease Cas2 [Enhydrobacter sp.]|nr:MAG: CRISPR-associated endonuclease Cas2 [Enhydrobacter sp.]